MKKWSGKQIIAMLLCLLIAFQALPFVAKADDTAGGSKTEVDLKAIDGVATPNDVFDELKLSASIKDKIFDLTFGLSLDNERLQAELKNAVMATGKTEDEANGIVADLLADEDEPLPEEYASKLPETGFTFTLDLAENAFKLPDGLLGTDKPWIIEEGVLKDEQVGTYSVVQNDDKTLTVSAKLNPTVYKWQDVSASASIGLEITKTGTGTKEPVIEENGGKITVDVNFNGGSNPPDPDEGDGEYTLTKEKKDIKDENTFTEYTVTAKATKGNLNGLILRDPIPKGLYVTEVLLNGKPLDKGEYTLTETGADKQQTFEYQFAKLSSEKEETSSSAPEESSSSAIQSEAPSSEEPNSSVPSSGESSSSASEPSSSSASGSAESVVSSEESASSAPVASEGESGTSHEAPAAMTVSSPALHTANEEANVQADAPASDAVPDDGAEKKKTDAEASAEIVGNSSSDKKVIAAKNDGENGAKAAEALEKKDTNEITEAVFTIRTQLTDEAYQAFLKEGKTITFTNKAALYKEGKDEPLKESNEVTSELQGHFFNKSGERVGLNGQYINWTINAQIYFTGGQAYLVDSIDGTDTTHMYEKDNNDAVPFTLNGNSQKAVNVSDAIAAKWDFEGLKNGTAASVVDLAALTNYGEDNQRAVYYVNDNQQAVMIIPLTDTDRNKPLKLEYRTKMAALTQADQAIPSQKKLENDATILWSKDAGTGGSGGTGGGTWEPAFTIDKSGVTIDSSLISKASGKYDEKTQIMPWTITVNKSGQTITDAVVTDVLDTGKQQFSGLGIGNSLKATKITTSTDGKETKTEVSIPIKISILVPPYSPPYYTIKESGGKQTLTIHLGTVKANEVYVLHLNTKVVDPSLLSKQGSGQVTNSATLTGKIGTLDVDQSTGDIKGNVTNTLLKKEAVDANGNVKNYYDFENHQVYWKVTVNPNHIKIKDGVLIDTLPTGAAFGKLVEVTKTTADGKVEKAKIDSNGTKAKFGNDILDLIPRFTIKAAAGEKAGTQVITFRKTITIPFLGDEEVPPHEFDDQFTLLFTTTFDKAYRDANFKNDQGKDTVIPNKIQLTGTVSVDGKNPQKIDMTSNAKHTVQIPAIAKQGQYFYKDYGDYGKTPYVTWQILLNADGINMENAKLTDTLQDWFQLDPDSLSIQAVKPGSISGNGPITNQTPKEYETTGGELKNKFSPVTSNSEFSFSIPKEYARTPLLITFTTLVVGDITKKENMSNSATLEWSDKSKSETGDQTAKDATVLSLSDIANASTGAQLRVLKTSTNTTTIDEKDKLPAFRLPGAKFTLTPMKLDGGKWVEDTSAKPLSGTTSSSGMIYFLYLKKDVGYQLTETTAPAGYKADTTTRYFVFPSGEPAATYPVGTEIRTQKGNAEAEYKAYRDPAVIENSPENDQGKYAFSFVKKSDDGNFVQGAIFTLTRDHLKTQTATSDSKGYVKFEGIDPGTYQLEETGVPAGFEKLDGIITVTISVDGKFTMTGNSSFLQHSENIADNDGYTVVNTRIRGTVTLNKRDAHFTEPLLLRDARSAGKPVSGAKFTVYSKSGDTPVAYLTESESTTGLYQLTDLESPVKIENGDPYLSEKGLLAGEYYLEETTTPAGYRPDTDENGKLKKYDFSISTQGQKVTVGNNALLGSDFYNTPVGSIQGSKVIAGSKQPLAGAVIGLFSGDESSFVKDKAIATILSENDGSFTFENLPYGTYKIAEVSAPPNYKLNTDTVFVVTVDQNTEAITQGFVAGSDETAQDIVIENTRKPGGGGSGGGGGGGNNTPGSSNGYIAIQKTSEDGVLSGFTFEITDGDSYTETFVTDEDGRIVTGVLPRGNYTIREIETDAVEGKYQLPEEQTVYVSGVGVKVSFVNKLLEDIIPPDEVPLAPGTPGGQPGTTEEIPDGDVPLSGGTFGPKTGYTGASPLWALMLALSLAGLGYSAVTLISAKKRGRHADK